MLDLEVHLKHDELCLVGRRAVDDPIHETGLYARDTRMLQRLHVTFAGHDLHRLDVQQPAPDQAIVTSTNPHLDHLGVGGEPQTVLVRQAIELGARLEVTFTVHNYGTHAISGELAVEAVCDFRDMFDVRGMAPRSAAVPLPAAAVPSGIVLAARGSDGQIVRTRITSPTPPEVESYPEGRLHGHPVSSGRLSWRLDLEGGAATTIRLHVEPDPLGAPVSARDYAASTGPRLHVACDDPDLVDFVLRCDDDLSMLQTSFPEGEMPAAGIPWFIAPFGRDSLIVALQTVHVYPERVASTLRTLAALQATAYDPWREAQPGRILHEMRYGDMARTGQIPHTPYYGSVDATPLFVMALAEHYLWHRDEDLLDELLPHAWRALEWVAGDGDLDGDGLVEYAGSAHGVAHIAQQGWKDSSDSLHFADGTPAVGPIALVEVQGYVFAAYRRLSQVLRLRGDEKAADELAARAERVRALVEDRFWLESEGTYAQALDGRKRPVDAVASNAGHLLFCGLPSPERAAVLATRLTRGDLDTGWGLRTLGSTMATYNPMSYHNGSIWPHDTSLAMAGMREYGHHAPACHLAMGLLRLARTDPRWRLDELYCGFEPGEEVPEPVNYPVSCRPQAWAAGAGLLALRTMLGLRADPVTRTVHSDPCLPDRSSRMLVTGLRAFGLPLEVRVERRGARWVGHVRTDLSA